MVFTVAGTAICHPVGVISPAQPDIATRLNILAGVLRETHGKARGTSDDLESDRGKTADRQHLEPFDDTMTREGQRELHKDPLFCTRLT